MKTHGIWLFLACVLLVPSFVPAQTKFYNYYTDGLDYMEKKDWLRAIQEFRSAISVEFEDAGRKRTYGTRFIEYYPHREIGICYYYLGETGNAKKELDLSTAYVSSKRANEYLGFMRKGGPPTAELEEEREEKTEEVVPEVVPPPRMEESRNVLPVGALTYDPSRVTQVGSRLGIAVMPINVKGEMEKYAGTLTDKMVSQLLNLRRFKVIDRTALDKVLQEQQLQVSGIVDDQAAVQVGKVAGADAIVVASIVQKGSNGRVSVRVIDTETSETVVARGEQVGGSDVEDYEKAVDDLAIMIYNEMPIVEGFIVSVEKDGFYIDMGSLKGVRKGSKCVAFREGENILHPATGKVMGKRSTKLGELVVVQVQEEVAQVRVVDKEQDIKIGDKVVLK
jgi:TolB-like protein